MKNLPPVQETLVWFLGQKDPPKEGIGYPLQYSWASVVAQLIKTPPAMQETWVWSLGYKDPLEKGTATHSSILAWKVPWIVESSGLQRARHNWATLTFSLNGLVIFPKFLHLSLNFAIRSSWSEPQSAPSLVFSNYTELLHPWLQRI